MQDHGLWTQLRIDKGREWYLMLFIQEKLSQHRTDTSKPAFLQTASKQVINAINLYMQVINAINHGIAFNLYCSMIGINVLFLYRIT